MGREQGDQRRLDPDKEAQALTTKASAVNTKIETGTPDPTDQDKLKLPAWLIKPGSFSQAKAADFTPPGQFFLFDPPAQPNTKRENPNVFTIGDYQVDLTRGAMPAFDIIYDNDGEPLIAVLIDKKENKLDNDKLKKAVSDLLVAGKRV